jgi:DNA-binding NarL/FixJ family response regulator
MHDDPAYQSAVLAAGGAGYVVKTAADAMLISAIRTVSQGRTFVDASLAKGHAAGARGGEAGLIPSASAKVGSLSPREHEVLELLAQGYTNQEIAGRLSLSVKTVETYRARITDKLGLRTRADITRYALEIGLLGPGKAGRESQAGSLPPTSPSQSLPSLVGDFPDTRRLRPCLRLNEIQTEPHG